MRVWIKSLWKDSLVYGVGYGVSRVLQIVILPIIAQALSLSEFGYYSNYVIFYTVSGGFFVLGLDSAVARYFYESEDQRYHQQLFSTAFFFILSVSIVFALIFSSFPVFLLSAMGIPTNYGNALPYVMGSVPAVALNGFFLSWFKWRRQKIIFLIVSSSSVVMLLVPLLVVHRVSFLYVFKVIFWGQLVVALASIVFAGRYIRPYFNRSLMFSLLKYGFPWMLVFVFGISRTYLDRAFLNQYLSANSYGLYNFSVRIASLLSLLITAFDMSFGPLAFSIWNKPGAKFFFARLQSMYTLVISAVACAICICSPVIIKLLGGDRYAGAEKVLPFLLFASIPLSLINFSNLGTVYAKKSFLSTVSLFVGFAGVLLLNLFLTNRFLQYGAASAALIGQLLIIVTGYFFSKNYYPIPFSYLKDFVVFVIFFILSLLTVQFGYTMQFDIIVEILILSLVLVTIFIFFYPIEYKKAVHLIRKSMFV